MSWEQALTPTLEQTLNLILSSLANFFWYDDRSNHAERAGMAGEVWLVCDIT